MIWLLALGLWVVLAAVILIGLAVAWALLLDRENR